MTWLTRDVARWGLAEPAGALEAPSVVTGVNGRRRWRRQPELKD